MKVRALNRFFDLKENTIRVPKDEFIVNKERAEELTAPRTPWVEEVKEKRKKKSGE